MTKCPNEMNNRSLRTMETRTITEENNGRQDNGPETIESLYMADNGLQDNKRQEQWRRSCDRRSGDRPVR